MKTKFYTGKGDGGESNLGGGKKISKDSSYAEFLGGLDELNSWFGLTRAESGNDFVSNSLFKIQQTLFIAQAEAAAVGAGRKSSKKITAEKTKELESIIEKIDSELPEINHFIVTGANRESALLDYGRTLARKTERLAVKLKKELNLSDEVISFLNRLSSVLFAFARYVSHKKGIKEDAPSY